MFKKLLVIATLAAGLISTQANAEFIHTDWIVTGDKKVTLDTTTGLEWLKLDYSRRSATLTSYDTKIQEGGVLFGWRQATQDEVESLMLSFFSWLTPQSTHNSAVNKIPYSDYAARDAFLTFFGRSASIDHHYSYGAYKDETGAMRVAGVSRWNGGSVAFDSIFQNDGYVSGWYVSDGGLTLSSINDPMINIANPNAPINMADVSAPAGLAAAGALMLILGARRKTA
ncbi:MAG: hypothetical protein ACK4GU_04420 [Alishewanella aestuarii]